MSSETTSLARTPEAPAAPVFPAAAPHDLAVGERVCTHLQGVPPGTVVALHPPTPGLPAGTAAVRHDGEAEPTWWDVTALHHADGRPASPIPLQRDPPPLPAKARNALAREARTGEDAEGRLRWAALLAHCRRSDHALARALDRLRRQGAALEPRPQGGCRLGAGAMEPAAYAKARGSVLMPHAAALGRLLAEVATREPW